MVDLAKSIGEMKSILYGNGEADPVDEACSQLTKEFFKENTNSLHLLVVCLPYMDLEVCQRDPYIFDIFQEFRCCILFNLSYCLRNSLDKGNPYRTMTHFILKKLICTNTYNLKLLII